MAARTELRAISKGPEKRDGGKGGLPAGGVARIGLGHWADANGDQRRRKRGKKYPFQGA